MHDWRWTNRSVALLAGDSDPVDAITEKARRLVLDALDKGWRGPPFDPFLLADICGIEVVARAGVRDARTVPVGRGRRFRIEFNPTRPAARVRYSVAHEIAHTLFPDCSEHVRYRAARPELSGDEWQLEALCNVGAAELLMPLGSFPKLREESMTIERLVELRRTYAVSMEALLIRAVRVSAAPVVAFAASRIETGTDEGGYRVEYTIPSYSSTPTLPRGTIVSADSAVAECIGIGFTATRDERWPGWTTAHRVECVGIPPYPGSRYPRVAGVLRGTVSSRTAPMLEYVRGDATEPRRLPAIIVQVVNNKARTWGGKGFAVAVRSRWPAVHEDFRDWATRSLRLGNVRLASAAERVFVASMVAQSGYGPSKSPRIRYAALRRTLGAVTQAALDRNATLHMPRIGAGEARGAWTIIEELIREECTLRGVSVTVYDLPGAPIPVPEQPSLPLAAD
ncbi:MAG: ImmA/IrrE family metallo-endopeptidase [Gemmatimonadetes bacterium]|nr:ImmA/IrrE family metallo-endopeptidase [Gemmatimonadota bacterium]MYG24389.1 ImmA/IrrE family metallo-endopeptidase [Gemmatimonadota bacterium]MYJ37942.1 ImmA/IrrE family metallo-endopeptidase [Gemmatimonadota bacterium]